MWKAIEETNGMIEVSDKGEIRSLLRGEPYILKTNKDTKGYHRICVTVNRVKKSYKLHREVAKAFIPNPDNLPQVNHKDGNKDNNSVSNLEWCTNQQNALHAIENGLWSSVFEGAKRVNDAKKRAVIGFFEADGTRMEFESVSEAERFVGSRHISDVLKGKRRHVKGWRFEYKEVVTNGDKDGNTKCETEKFSA